MKIWQETIVILGLSSTISVAGFLYSEHLRKEKVSRCKQILQESQIQDRYFCESILRRHTLFELIDEYGLEDRRLAYELANNKWDK